jgi:hypothetical protein
MPALSFTHQALMPGLVHRPPPLSPSLTLFRYGIKDENIPSWEDMRAQMRVSIQAIPLYTMLPPFAEWFIRNGYTLCYSRVDTVGWPMYAVYFVMYMASVEVRPSPSLSWREIGLESLLRARFSTPCHAHAAAPRPLPPIRYDTSRWDSSPAPRCG